jgi:hypothetical protein
MNYSVYGLQKTRIILFEDDGFTPRYRITLQKETREGLELVFKPDGVLHQLGSGAGWRRQWIHRGHRVSLAIKWSLGLESTVETFDAMLPDGVTFTWLAATTIPTAQALSVIHTWACRNPCRVSPHLDLAFDFLAQPDPGQAFTLRDLKGFAHTGLTLELISTVLVKGIPDWITANDYFTAGYADDGYAGYTP